MSITSSGADVNGTADRFSFVYRPISGNATIIARVAALPFASAWAQAGVMIRESLQAGSRHGFVMTSAGNGTMFRRRTTTSGSTAQTDAFSASGAGGGTATASWLKLQRVGSVLTAWSSDDGVAWNTIGSATVTLPTTAYVGLAVASGTTAAGVTASLADVVVVGNGTLDAGFTGADIGAPATSGGSWSSAGAFMLDGAGIGIGGTSDQFRFVYKLVSGDMDIVTRVADFDFATSTARAGLMVRTTIGATSAHRSLLAGPQGLYYVSRGASGGTTAVTSAGTRTAPVWLKASRRGSVLTFSHSLDNVSWSQVTQQTVSGSYYVGLAVTSANTTKFVRAHFTSTALTAVVPNQPPAVSLTSPASSLSISGPLALAATASDSDGSVAAVEFWANSTLLGTDTTAPYQSTFNAGILGIYTLKAVARDNSGATTTSATRTVTVLNVLPNVAPLVSLTSPQVNQSFALPATVTIAATASDADGSIQRVDFYEDATLIYSDTVAPYSYAWTNPAAGSYAVRAVAYDDRGAMTQSSTRDITVAAGGIPSKVVFNVGSIWDLVLWYVLDIFPAGADTRVARPVSTIPLGLPALVAYEATVDVGPAIAALPPGQYVATVSSVSLLDGTLRSDPSPVFIR
jgi:hypothetical protein